MNPELMHPAADPDAVVVAGNARFTVLTPALVRLEWSPDGRFEDRASLIVVNRRLPVPRFTALNRKGWLTLETDSLVLRYRVKKGRFDEDNLAIEVKAPETPVTWTPGMEDSGNLGGTVRTLDGVSGSTPLDPGLLSRDGWVLLDDSRTLLLDGGSPDWPTPRPDTTAIDWYFFGYGHQYTRQLEDYTSIAGRIPLPPRWSFGAWWSRYWAYSADELKQLVHDFNEHDVPLDVLVIDMDWHLKGWTGYTWNRDLFPDPRGFLDWVHKQGLHTTLNLHPHDGVRRHEAAFPAMARAMGLNPDSTDHIRFDIASKRYMRAYFDILHHPLEKEGVDFWWIDWQQGEASSIPGLDPLFWLNHLHWRDMEQRQDSTGKRPLLFSRWGGLGSHRYQIGFSGDTFNDWPSLAFQPYFTATAGNVAYPFWSHDIGGHQPGPVEGELYTRWIQYAVVNPILRTHATKNPLAERRIWMFGDEVFHVARDAFRLRYSLVPYIYSSARQAYDRALPLLRPLYYEWPELDDAYTHPGEYLFGDQLLAAPVTVARDEASRTATTSVWFPPGTWYHWYTGEVYEGPGNATLMTPLEQMPLFARAGAIIPAMPVVRRIDGTVPGELIFHVFPGDSGTVELYEDDGVSAQYEEGVFTTTPVRMRRTSTGYNIAVGPVNGSFEGLPDTRGYRILLRNVPPPETVSLDSTVLPRVSEPDNAAGNAWWYDADRICAVIRVTGQDIRSELSLAIAGLPEGDPALVGLQGKLARLDTFTRLYGENAPAAAEELLMQRKRLADSTSTASDGLALADDVALAWPGLAAEFATADVPDTLRREVFLRMNGIAMNLATRMQELPQPHLASALSLQLLEPVAGLSVRPVLSLPDGLEGAVSTQTPSDFAPLAPDTPFRMVTSLPASRPCQTLRLHYDVAFRGSGLDITVPLERVLFPSINAWQVIGPFDNPGRHDLDRAFGPDSSLDLDATWPGKDGEADGWRLVQRPDSLDPQQEFVVDLQQVFGGYTEDAVAYGLTYIQAPHEMDAVLALGSDDGVAVWVNGEQVHHNEVGRAYTSRADRVPIHLRQGVNTLLLKVSQGNGSWAFGAHLEDDRGHELTSLRITSEP